MQRYAKFVFAALVTVISAIVAAKTGDDYISDTEWVNVAIQGVGALAVFTAPNIPGARYTKAIVAALTAVLALLASSITGGVSDVELLQLLIAAAGAVGVYAVPNQPELTTAPVE